MPEQPHTNRFDRVDRSHDPDFFIRFMDEAQKPAAIATSEQVIVDRTGLKQGDAVLDVGCGPGTDVLALIDLVGPSGRVVGIDASEVMIAEARRRAERRAVSVTFDVGDVHALPYADATFDICRAARLLEHLPDPRRALAEMVRVTRHGGRVAVFDFDWDTLIIDHPDKETTRTIVLTYSDSIRNGWIGRQLPRLFEQTHLKVISVDPVQVFAHYSLAELFLGSHLAELQNNRTLTAAQAQQWWEYLQRANDEETLLISFTAFVVVGAIT